MCSCSQDKLFIDLTRDLKGGTDWQGKPGGIVVEKIPRSEGVVARSPAIRKDARKQRIREYFYGKDGSFGPHASTVSFDDVTLVKLSGITVICCVACWSQAKLPRFRVCCMLCCGIPAARRPTR